MPAFAAYLVLALAALFFAFKLFRTISIFSAAALLVLPLCLTGRAMLGGGVFAPLDLAYQSEPLASMAAQSGIHSLANTSLSDVSSLMIPWREAVRYSWSHGQWPLWNPFVFCGDILAAGSEAAPYHPIHLIADRVPMPGAINLAAALTLFCSALFMFLLLRDFDCGEGVCLIASAAWMLGSMMVFFLQTPLGLTACSLPLLFLAVRHLMRHPRIGAMIGLALALTFATLAGHPETLLHVVFISAIYGLYELRRAAPNRRRILALAAGGGILALLIGAIHLLPLLDALPQTIEYRLRNEMKAREWRISTWDEVGYRALGQVIPFIHGANEGEHARVPGSYLRAETSYVGTSFLAFMVYGLWRSRRRERWFFLGLFIFGLLAGLAAPIVTHALVRLPLFSLAINERLILAAALSTIILGAFGLDEALRELRRKEFVLFSAGAAAILIGVLMALWPRSRQLGLSAEFMRSSAIPFLIPLVTIPLIFLLVRSRSARTALTAAVIVFPRLIELGGMIPTVPARAYYPPLRLFRALPRDGTLFRVVGQGLNLYPNSSTHYQLEDPRGFSGMTFERLFSTFQFWSTPQPVWFNRVDDLSSTFLSFLNVRFAISTKPDLPPRGWRVIAAEGRVRLFENMEVQQRAFVPSEVRLGVPSSETIREMAASREFLRHVWITASLVGSETGAATIPNGPGQVQIRRDGLRYVIDADMQQPGWVVVSETGWKGWKGRADGKDLPLFFANHAFLAFRLEAGAHRVVLRYRPDSFVLGRAVSLLSVLIILIYLSWNWLRSHRPARGVDDVGMGISSVDPSGPEI